MKEAIGTSMVFNLIIIFVGVMIALLFGYISYSKGFKIRNRILDRMEEYKVYNNDAKDAIAGDLKAMGYQTSTSGKCKIVTKRSKNTNYIVSPMTDSTNPYDYCVYQYRTTKGVYYGVTVYITLNFPIVNSIVRIPLYGETKIIYDKGMVEG